MDNKTFNEIVKRIKTDPNVQITKFYDGNKYTDPQGNWYGWTDCGYVEHLFYAGDEWTRRTLADGQRTEPEKVQPFRPKTEPAKLLCEWLGEEMDCQPCVFGFVYGCGCDAECPALTRDEMRDCLEEIQNKAREALTRLGA